MMTIFKKLLKMFQKKKELNSEIRLTFKIVKLIKNLMKTRIYKF